MKKLYKQILKAKKQEVKEIKRNFSDDILKAAAFSVGGEFRSVEINLKMKSQFQLFMEIKSILFPEKTPRENFRPLTTVREWHRNGLESGIIIATDRSFLGGDPGWINLIKSNTTLPVIQRDFFLEPVQIYQSRAIGADAILLDTSFTPAGQLPALMEAASLMGLEIFLEITDLSLSPEILQHEALTGIIINLERNGNGHFEKEVINGLSAQQQAQVMILGRLYPHAQEEIAALKALNFRGLAVNDEFWQEDDALECFKRLQGWCAGVSGH